MLRALRRLGAGKACAHQLVCPGGKRAGRVDDVGGRKGVRGAKTAGGVRDESARTAPMRRSMASEHPRRFLPMRSVRANAATAAAPATQSPPPRTRLLPWQNRRTPQREVGLAGVAFVRGADGVDAHSVAKARGRRPILERATRRDGRAPSWMGQPITNVSQVASASRTGSASGASSARPSPRGS